MKYDVYLSSPHTCYAPEKFGHFDKKAADCYLLLKESENLYLLVEISDEKEINNE